MEDRVPDHFAVTVRKFLSELLQYNDIKVGLQRWPSRSPDLPPISFFPPHTIRSGEQLQQVTPWRGSTILMTTQGFEIIYGQCKIKMHTE
jgi:hypothetical protein